jgi:ketol-acid reductoisomerase
MSDYAPEVPTLRRGDLEDAIQACYLPMRQAGYTPEQASFAVAMACGMAEDRVAA